MTLAGRSREVTDPALARQRLEYSYHEAVRMFDWFTTRAPYNSSIARCVRRARTAARRLGVSVPQRMLDWRPHPSGAVWCWDERRWEDPK